MSSAYVIGHITVKDTEKWTEYRNQVPANLELWWAELVLRGKLASILDGHSTVSLVSIWRILSWQKQK